MMVNDAIPYYIQRQLNQPLPDKGQRHDRLLSLSLQMVGQGIADDITFDALRTYCPDTDKADREIRNLIRGAHKRNPTPAKSGGEVRRGSKQGNRATVQFTPPNHRRVLPTDLEETTPFEFLDILFGPEAFICISRADGTGAISRNEIRSVREWPIAMTEADLNEPHGVWFCINPLLDQTNRNNDSVADFRFCLVECDGDGTVENLEQQYSNLLDTELPIAAIYSSAGKSIHALVKIEATNATQFKERVEGVYSHLSDLPGIDRGRKAPSQLSRLPGAFRAGVRQSLLSWTTGAPSFDAWQDNLGKRKLAGSALADYVEREIPREDILLGNRYLCRGSGMFVVAPSGVGKSVFSIQAAIEWGAGRAAFGIKPTQPLRVLIIQAEDDTGDVIEMAQIARHLRLTDPDVKVLRENVWIEPLNDLTGVDFLHALDGFLDQFAADLVIINPYTSYVGCEVKDDGLNNVFLRNTLNPILTRHQCGVMIIHHTPKTNFRDTTGWRPSDWMYSGAGASCLTNWARAYLVIEPTDLHGVYKFIAAKRGERIGWGYDYPVFETFWSHCKESGKLLWVPASEAEIKASAKTEKTADDLLKILPIGRDLRIEEIQKLAKAKLKIGQKATVALIKELVDCKSVLPISIPRSGTCPEKKYRRETLADC